MHALHLVLVCIDVPFLTRTLLCVLCA
uniref:Uncharacterized protein n=1 Tax=Arundo donax TaxID=35708 RepID=A0A0A9A8L8_ARUDO